MIVLALNEPRLLKIDPFKPDVRSRSTICLFAAWLVFMIYYFRYMQ